MEHGAPYGVSAQTMVGIDNEASALDWFKAFNPAITVCRDTAVIRSPRSSLRELGKGGIILFLMTVGVPMTLLQGCEGHGARSFDIESGERSMSQDGGVRDQTTKIQSPFEAVKDPAAITGNNWVAPILNSRRKIPTASTRSGTGFSDADRFDTDAEAGLIGQQMRINGRINTLDSQLRALDRSPPSHIDRGADHPEALGRRRNLERRALKSRERSVRRELQRLQHGQRPISASVGSRTRNSQNLFGGSRSY